MRPNKSMDSAKPIYKFLLKQNTQIVDLITHGSVLHKLGESIKPYINQYIGEHWQLADVSSETITLVVNSAEHANRLRFCSVKLVSQISSLESFKLLKKINIKVCPTDLVKIQANKPAKKCVLRPSQTGQQQLMSLAETVADPALKASLRRLAKHLQADDQT